MPVPFRFDTVLRVREVERDRCRQALALEQQRQASLAADRDRVSSERLAVLEEVRQAHLVGGLPADQELARHRYAEQLAGEIARLANAIQEAGAAVAQCLNELLEADTAVKALEKLAGRHTEEQQRAEQTNAERDRDDGWRTGRVA